MCHQKNTSKTILYPIVKKNNRTFLHYRTPPFFFWEDQSFFNNQNVIKIKIWRLNLVSNNLKFSVYIAILKYCVHSDCFNIKKTLRFVMQTPSKVGYSIIKNKFWLLRDRVWSLAHLDCYNKHKTLFCYAKLHRLGNGIKTNAFLVHLQRCQVIHLDWYR